MQADINELNARIANLIRIATVIDVDYEKAKACVEFGQTKSTWLPWITAMAGKNSTWSPLEIGSQVVILSPSGSINQGIILPCLYHQKASRKNGSPQTYSTHYDDGSVIIHKSDTGETLLKNSGELIIYSEGAVTIKSAKSVNINAESITLTADTITFDTKDAKFTGNVVAAGTIHAKNI